MPQCHNFYRYIIESTGNRKTTASGRTSPNVTAKHCGAQRISTPNEPLAQLCRQAARAAMESGLEPHLMMETSVACQQKGLFES
jgi:hypothetical protein